MSIRAFYDMLAPVQPASARGDRGDDEGRTLRQLLGKLLSRNGAASDPSA